MKPQFFNIAQRLFGFGFFVFGINGFLHFMETPPVTAEAGALLGALGATGYFFPMIKGIETVVGVCLLANVFAPLAIVVIAPVLVGITTIHLFLNPAGLPMMLVLHALHGFVAYGFRSVYGPLLKIKP